MPYKKVKSLDKLDYSGTDIFLVRNTVCLYFPLRRNLSYLMLYLNSSNLFLFKHAVYFKCYYLRSLFFEGTTPKKSGYKNAAYRNHTFKVQEKVFAIVLKFLN